MNLLDENIIKDQRLLLKGWRIHVRHIGHDIGRRGIQDKEIIPFLLRLSRPTFFTRDFGFYEWHLCHAQYCLVQLAVKKDEVAVFVRRLLRHHEFDTGAKRMGAVIRVAHVDLSVWRLHAEQELHFDWTD